MKLLTKIFSFSREKETAHKLYRSIVEQARQPVFYTDLGVADTFDGRFDMISLHMILVIRRMKNDVEQTRKLSQALFDYMFDDIDLNLREMGIGDMGVVKRVKKMAKAFYGRLESYDKGLADEDNTTLRDALERNLYRDTDPLEANLAAMADYMRSESSRLDGLDISSMIDGKLEFGSAPEPQQQDAPNDG